MHALMLSLCGPGTGLCIWDSGANETVSISTLQGIPEGEKTQQTVLDPRKPWVGVMVVPGRKASPAGHGEGLGGAMKRGNAV